MTDLEHTLKCCLYTLVAELITSDHTIENAEVDVAGNLCQKHFPELASRLKAPDQRSRKLSDSATAFFVGKENFDIRDFCSRSENSPDTDAIIGILSNILDGRGKVLLMNLLHEVAGADSNIAGEESSLLTKIAEEMGQT